MLALEATDCDRKYNNYLGATVKYVFKKLGGGAHKSRSRVPESIRTTEGTCRDELPELNRPEISR